MSVTATLLWSMWRSRLVQLTPKLTPFGGELDEDVFDFDGEGKL